MRKYLITFCMHNGDHGSIRGLFANDWDALDCALGTFHDARVVAARRLP